MQLMELLEYGLTSSPVTQTEPIMAAMVRIVSGLLQTAKRYESVDPLISDLQLRIPEKCSDVLGKGMEERAKVSEVQEFFLLVQDILEEDKRLRCTLRKCNFPKTPLGRRVIEFWYD